MEKERLDKILNILKSSDLMQKRRDFIDKYKIPEDLIYPDFNYYIGEYIRENISFEECVDGIYYSEFPYDNFFLKKNIILDYLEIHLLPIKDLLDEKTEDLLNIANEYFENGASLFIGDDEEDSNKDNLDLDLPLPQKDVQVLEKEQTDELENLKYQEEVEKIISGQSQEIPQNFNLEINKFDEISKKNAELDSLQINELEEKEIGAKHVSKELSDGEFDPFSDPTYIVDEVINILELKFIGEEKREIFYDHVTKYIKNIRNKFQTFNILTRSEKDGGFEMDKLSVDKILDIVENIKKEKENFLLSKHEEKKQISLDKMASLPQSETKGMELKNLKDLYNESSVVDSGIENKEYNYKAFDGSIEDMYSKESKIENKEEENSFLSLEDSVDYSKSKLVGPIEELALFTIKDFRNSGPDMKSKTNIIERNIKILEAYSVKKKILGIKAWLASEVCKVYKEMINESIQYGSIKKVISSRKEKGLVFLTEEEIEGIFELNNKLRM